MTPETVMTIGRQALEMTMMLAAPLLLVAGPWMLRELVSYTRTLIESIPSLVG